MISGDHMALNKYAFAVEYIDIGVGHFGVYQQRHAKLLHGFERLLHLAISVTPESELVVAPAG